MRGATHSPARQLRRSEMDSGDKAFVWWWGLLCATIVGGMFAIAIGGALSCA